MPSLRRNYFLLRIALVSIAALLASVPVRNESNRDRDGNWWISQEQLAKYSYMVGFFDGMELGENFSIWGMMKTPTADPAVGKAVSSYDQFSNKYLTNVTNGQVVQGLDEFYSDYRNRRIKVASGVWIVLNEISGKSKDEMQKLIETYRKNAVQSP
jgi:hypothetical protein